jgi:hypothetical protein
VWNISQSIICNTLSVHHIIVYKARFIHLQLEAIIREKLKSGYYIVKQAFKQYDPEGRGIITRLAWNLLIITTIIITTVTASTIITTIIITIDHHHD